MATTDTISNGTFSSKQNSAINNVQMQEQQQFYLHQPTQEIVTEYNNVHIQEQQLIHHQQVM